MASSIETYSGRQIQELIDLVRRRYPAWDGFDHPPFVADEIEYKQETAERVQALLGRFQLETLLDGQEHDEILSRIEQLAKATNLLYLRTPKTSDLAILYHPHLQPERFSREFFELLYGEGDAPSRLEEYVETIGRHSLPNHWPFPTYFLFFSNPETEFFVKPTAARWFLRLTGQGDLLESLPSGQTYAALRQNAQTLKAALRKYRPQSMIDIQSFVWVCHRESQARVGRLTPKAQIELDVPSPQYTAPYEYNYQPTSHTLMEEPEGDLMTTKELAPVFREIFTAWDDAAWAFDLLQKSASLLGIEDSKDPRCSLTLPKGAGGRILRFMFGPWIVLDFIGPSSQNREHLIEITLSVEHADLEGFTKSTKTWIKEDALENEPELALYQLPFDLVQSMDNRIKEAYEVAFDVIKLKFGDWRKNPQRRLHEEAIFDAVFDKSLRSRILEGSPLISNGKSESDKSGETSKDDAYSLSDLSAETGHTQTELTRWIQAVERKGQAILYGPPGTGKTYLAERLARHLTAESDGFSELVQFHPAYAYEDFIQGIRPQTSDDGRLTYPMKAGRFLDFCQRAANRDGRCVLIIDEINRANLSRVFGELMYLLEYRDRRIPLSGGGSFRIPGNVRLIGTMNTADRSIALVDHALRRRFAFIRLAPNYDILRRYHRDTGFPVEGLITTLARLNTHIGDPHYEIGHTFFLRENLSAELPDIWQMEIEPYLEEYFFDRSTAVDTFRWENINQDLEQAR